jgi:hypothetical protein
MRQAMQAGPLSGVPQAGQASNSASAGEKLMRASCRNPGWVVTARAADYHLRMPVSASREYRLVDRAGPGERVVLREEAGDRAGLLVVSGYRGPSLPAAITNARIEPRSGRDAWRLAGEQGYFDFEARAVDEIETCPSLYSGLHRPFALAAGDRFAVRVLLALLRLPGGPRLLRLWHAGRST